MHLRDQALLNSFCKNIEEIIRDNMKHKSTIQEQKILLDLFTASLNYQFFFAKLKGQNNEKI